jgi:putative endonuclease
VGADHWRALGRRGEDAAAQWYRDGGYVIVARNWRCRDGEIDIVARAQDGTLVICEVKTRSSSAFGSPFEAVTVAKQGRLRRLASRWLASAATGRGHFVEIRFDVAGVTRGPDGALVVEVLEGAF